jgi:hypothetical protein
MSLPCDADFHLDGGSHFFSSFPLTSVAQPGDDLELLIVDQTI